MNPWEAYACDPSPSGIRVSPEQCSEVPKLCHIVHMDEALSIIARREIRAGIVSAAEALSHTLMKVPHVAIPTRRPDASLKERVWPAPLAAWWTFSQPSAAFG